MSGQEKYDWASAILSIASNKTNDIGQLAKAANLDPIAGDLSDVDLSGLDLSGQDFSGWDLKNAKFVNARLVKTEFRNASVDPESLIEAIAWDEANLDEHVRAAAQQATARRHAILMRKVDGMDFSVRTMNCLRNGDIILLGDLVQKTEAELLRIPNFARRSLGEVKEQVGIMGLRLGMDLDNWPQKTTSVRT